MSVTKKHPDWVIVVPEKPKPMIGHGWPEDRKQLPTHVPKKPVQAKSKVSPEKNTTLIAMMLLQKPHTCAYCKCELTKENAEIDKNDIGGPVLVCGRCNDRTK